MEKSFRPWDKSVLYQVYPWSFNEDEQRQPQLGNGSIKGMTEKLPYLVDLGVDAVWVSPPYQGPMRDAGYDISDFKSIHESLGTMEDFDEFVAECHVNGVRVMLDFI
ncbi:alpha,alpha-phosphotrehalase, partial [Candidatus Saccharibacteria bacterium]|nr:alpha,alpha-phosphotrehalase [Candidatus Saccharibacteria bacterium]